MVLDPAYEFTDASHLRWGAERETVYPLTFVIDKDRKATYAKISKTHGGRANPGEILLALEQ